MFVNRVALLVALGLACVGTQASAHEIYLNAPGLLPKKPRKGAKKAVKKAVKKVPAKKTTRKATSK